MNSYCERCGEELDDFTPCACVFSGQLAPRKPTEGEAGKSFRGSMRQMSHRKRAGVKLSAQAPFNEKGKVG